MDDFSLQKNKNNVTSNVEIKRDSCFVKENCPVYTNVLRLRPVLWRWDGIQLTHRPRKIIITVDAQSVVPTKRTDPPGGDRPLNALLRINENTVFQIYSRNRSFF